MDVSDCGAIACSLVLLLELLSLPEINGKYILLVFNKIDLAVQSDFDKYYTVMDVDELMGAFRDKMFFFEGTAATATIASNRRGIDCSSVVKNALSSDILEWFKTKYFTSSTLS